MRSARDERGRRRAGEHRGGAARGGGRVSRRGGPRRGRKVGWDANATEGGETEPRRIAARRYERGGRFASAFFFVEESRMMKEELELEAEEGEKGKPLMF